MEEAEENYSKCFICDHVDEESTGTYYKNHWFCNEHTNVAERIRFNAQFGTD